MFEGDAGYVTFECVLERAQSEQDRRQRLARFVVQFPREPPSFELLRRNAPRCRAIEASVFDRNRGLCRKQGDELFVFARELPPSAFSVR